MLTGFNTDFKYKGVVYHVQTEDNGVHNPIIVTLLYQGGAILASRKLSYADIIKSEHLRKVVKQLMEEQHKQVIKDLVSGKFGTPGHPEPEPAGPVVEARDEPVPEAEPPAGGAKPAKSLDEVILDYLASEDADK